MIPPCVLNLTFDYDYLQTLNLLWSYIFIYNLSLLPLFAVLFQLPVSNLKTFNYFSTIGLNYILTKIILISFLSAAGVPPFAGFFSKIFIFTLLCNSNFSFLFIIFFILVFVGLYFYVQNIRFLCTSNVSNGNLVFEKNIRISLNFYYLAFPNLFLLVFSFLFIDDLFIFIKWCVL